MKVRGSDRNYSFKRGHHRIFVNFKGEQQKIEQNTIKTKSHRFLTSSSDGNQNFQ